MISIRGETGGIGDEQILKAAAAVGILGSGPSSAPRILAALCNPDADSGAISSLIEKEPGLSVRVLRVANSAFYGVGRNVTTLDRALFVLGLDAVRGIAAAACMDRTVMGVAEAAPIDLGALVRHSLGTASAAEALARIHHRSLAQEAFMAGLLHNLGLLVQLRLDPEGVKAIVAELRIAPDSDIRALEATLAKVGHEECVGVIFESWRLPVSLIEATANHHQPMTAADPYRPLAALVQLGAQLSLACGNRFALEPSGPSPNDVAMQLLGLTDADLGQVAEDLSTRLKALRQGLAD